jgi:hypothetical protein
MQIYADKILAPNGIKFAEIDETSVEGQRILVEVEAASLEAPGLLPEAV